MLPVEKGPASMGGHGMSPRSPWAWMPSLQPKSGSCVTSLHYAAETQAGLWAALKAAAAPQLSPLAPPPPSKAPAKPQRLCLP